MEKRLALPCLGYAITYSMGYAIPCNNVMYNYNTTTFDINMVKYLSHPHCSAYSPKDHNFCNLFECVIIHEGS